MKNLSNAIAKGCERFSDLSYRALARQLDDHTCSHVAGALLTIVLGGFIVGRLFLIVNLLVKSVETSCSSDPEEAAPSRMILSSGEEIGVRWAELSEEFLSTGEGLLAGVLPQVSSDSPSDFGGQFVECQRISRRITIDVNDKSADDKFKALQFVAVAGVLYGVLSENEFILARLRSDHNVSRIFDRLNEITRNESWPLLPEVLLSVRHYVASKAEALLEAARGFVSFTDVL